MTTKRRLIVPVTFYAVATPTAQDTSTHIVKRRWNVRITLATTGAVNRTETHLWDRLGVSRYGVVTDTTTAKRFKRRWISSTAYAQALATTPATAYYRDRLGVSRYGVIGDG